jgi:hypothetical protein
MPALLVVDHAIYVGNDCWILEDPGRRFERDSVFPPVDAVLPLISRENHLYIQDCITFEGRSLTDESPPVTLGSPAASATPPYSALVALPSMMLVQAVPSGEKSNRNV